MEENTPLNDKDKKPEKEYVFNEHQHGSKPPRIIRVKESELTKPQKDLLLGEVIKRFNDLPDELKDKFMTGMFDSVQENRRLNPSPRIKAMQDAAMKTIYDKINAEVKKDSSPE